METAIIPQRLSALPLWRLLVMLDDTERTIGAGSETARILSRIIRERMKSERPHATGGTNASR